MKITGLYVQPLEFCEIAGLQAGVEKHAATDIRYPASVFDLFATTKNLFRIGLTHTERDHVPEIVGYGIRPARLSGFPFSRAPLASLDGFRCNHAPLARQRCLLPRQFSIRHSITVAYRMCVLLHL